VGSHTIIFVTTDTIFTSYCWSNRVDLRMINVKYLVVFTLLHKSTTQLRIFWIKVRLSGLNRASTMNIGFGQGLGLWFRAPARLRLQNEARLQVCGWLYCSSFIWWFKLVTSFQLFKITSIVGCSPTAVKLSSVGRFPVAKKLGNTASGLYLVNTYCWYKRPTVYQQYSHLCAAREKWAPAYWTCFKLCVK